MKNIQKRFVLASVLLIVAVTTSGCSGTGSGSLRENLFARRSTPVSGQSAKTLAAVESQPAKIDLDAAKKGASAVALASYESQNGKTGQTSWLRSYDEAVKLSEQTGKPILADFTGSNWCGYCVKLKKEVFDTPQFKTWAADNVVLLELDYPRPNLQADWIKQQNEMLRDRYSIERYPSVLILSSDGSVIGKQGYMAGGPDRWTAVAGNTIRSNRALSKAEFVDVSSLEKHK